ncbi:TetR family transcriptional regulator [Massilia sp. WF1]|uniref:TetR family transcriptional regulator n=1 Tax=unclassified Massilia TaxID=2609279 RepID=UPI00064A4D79|nr:MULTISPECIES: TetR family transcriptional regulator [unclassified Massilia]ALK97194.1 TetR family transcriptional regulator [Massilia sp. WG5]KLU36376.1 TetR family transcriptional regulator [Massilia sp. WF1]
MTKPSRSKAASKAEEDGTRDRILNVALQEFSRHGLSGARIDAIAAESGLNKGMIYYYFGSKEDLYVAALEESYRRFRQIEGEFHVDESLAPEPALRKLVGATFDFHAAHPEFIRMVMGENINHGEYIRKIPELRAINRSAITVLERLCQRGIAEGVFRADVDPVDLHMSISALSFYNVSNRHTFSFIFDRDLGAPEVHAARRESVVDTILRSVRAS